MLGPETEIQMLKSKDGLLKLTHPKRQLLKRRCLNLFYNKVEELIFNSDYKLKLSTPPSTAPQFILKIISLFISQKSIRLKDYKP